MLLYIIRHGDPDYTTDTLTERGKQQAEAVALRLQRSGITKVFSSPMGRAKETAAPTCRLLSLPCGIEAWSEEIGEERFRDLSERADPARSPIRKKRYLYEYDGQLFEIDVFPFWDDRAVMELELENEEQEIRLPPAIEIVREVTSDGRYTNSALAREIVRETI